MSKKVLTVGVSHEDAIAAVAAIQAEADEKKREYAESFKAAITAKKAEIRELQESLTGLQETYAKLTGKAIRNAGGRKARMPAERMTALMASVGNLKKGKEYKASELGEAIGAAADELKSVMIRAKADGVLVGNGKVGKAGRVSLK